MSDTYVAARRFAWLSSFYGGLCRKVLRDRRLFAGFVLAAALQAIGHGAMTVVAGLLGRSLVTSAGLTLPAWGQPFGQTTLALVGLLGACAKAVGATVGATAQSRLAQNVAIELRGRFAHDLMDEGTSLSAGHLSARVSVALREVELGTHEGFLATVRASLQLVPLTIALFWMSSRAAFATVLLVAPFLLVMRWGRRRWKEQHKEAVLVAEALHRELDELVAHMDVWRTFGARERASAALELLGARAKRAASSAEGQKAFLSSANEVLAAAALVVGFGFADRSLLPAAHEGWLVALATVVFMSYRPLRELGDARTALERGELALASLDQLTRGPSMTAAEVARGDQDERAAAGRRVISGGARREPTGAPGRTEALLSPASLTWRRETLVVRELGVLRGPALVCASRPRAASLSTATFTVKPGDIVAIAGPIGSGKTTLLRALLGLEPDVSGAVFYGDRELTRAGVGPGERPFAWVPQDAPLLAGTLLDNVLLGRTATQPWLEVLARLGAGQLVERLGNDALGAIGRPVSGGERKWIAIARAVAVGLPVLLLDEPTAGLDAAAQRDLLRALEQLRESHTIVLVSHQPEPLAIAQQVVRMREHAQAKDCPKVALGLSVAQN